MCVSLFLLVDYERGLATCVHLLHLVDYERDLAICVCSSVAAVRRTRVGLRGVQGWRPTGATPSVAWQPSC